MGGVYDIAAPVRDWLAAGREVRVATVVATRGLSSRRAAATAAWTPGEPVAGELPDAVSIAELDRLGLVEVNVSDAAAAAAGLACGGSASVLVQDAASLPPQLWDRLLAREPACLVTPVRDGAAGPTALLTPETVRASHAFADAVPRLFARGVTTAALLDEGAVVVLWPVPRLVVMGDGLIAEALRDVAAVLGWNCETVPEVRAAVAAAGELQASDALVVLSHDRAADGPTLAAGVAGRAGYVGALGSRRTQLARREWLTEHGVPAGAQARIHGPAGLDIGAHTPAEIAVSIVAEILAGRSAGSGGALRDREGPVHVSGVQAPPPRYPVSDAAPGRDPEPGGAR